VTTIDPAKFLADLKNGASKRKCNSLDLIYGILERHTASGERDFSIATIGRLSASAGGPSSQSIRNPGGLDYRRLIEVWAQAHGTTRKKPPSQGSRPKVPTRDADILKRIEDPALRAVVGAIMAERNRFQNELRVLKSQTEFTIDRRPVKGVLEQPVELLPSLAGVLNDAEREALEHAISEKLLTERGWRAFENGRVKDENNRHLYKPGYLLAIKKILTETNHG